MKSIELIKAICSERSLGLTSNTSPRLENETTGIQHQRQHQGVEEEDEEDSQTTYLDFDQSSLTLQSTINMNAKEMVRSIGALLVFLTTYSRKDHFEHDQPICSIHSFIPLDLNNFMVIDRVGWSTSLDWSILSMCDDRSIRFVVWISIWRFTTLP